MRIFVDMDGTLAEWRNIVLNLTVEEESNPQIVSRKLHEILTTKGYYLSLKPNKNMIDAVSILTESPEQYEVFILSCYLEDTDHSSPVTEKNEWLDFCLPMIDQVHRIFVPNGEDKTKYVPGGLRPSDILIDDYTKNLMDWQRAGGNGLKFLNGINATKGTWKGPKIYYYDSGNVIAGHISKISSEKTLEQEDMER